jgi:hypothetical protein
MAVGDSPLRDAVKLGREPVPASRFVAAPGFLPFGYSPNEEALRLIPGGRR